MQPRMLIHLCNVSSPCIRSSMSTVTPFSVSQGLRALRMSSVLSSSSLSSSSQLLSTRSFNSSSPLNSRSSLNIDSAQSRAADWTQTALQKLQHASKEELKHWSSLGLAAGLPIALILSPSKLAIPFDLFLGVAIPVHMHIGVTAIIDDYIPRSYHSIAHLALLIFTVGAAIGALKINLCGPGLAESVKSLWRSPKKEVKKIEEKKVTPTTQKK